MLVHVQTSMTTNAYLFAWDQKGIDSIVPITQYEDYDKNNTWNVLTNQPTERNPLWSILQGLILRARYNSQRHYEIYSVDCAFEIDEAEWREIWANDPQGTADLIRARGVKLYSDREDRTSQVIQ
jgi:hypothetical protein